MQKQSDIKCNWKFQLALSVAIFAIFSIYVPALGALGLDLTNGTLLSEGSRLFVSVALATVCGCLIREELEKKNPLHLSGRTKILLGLLGAVFLIVAFQIGMFFNWMDVLQLDPVSILKCFFIAVAAAVFEELLVRGLILSALEKAFQNSRHRLLLAGLISALIFGALHYYNLFQNASLGEINQQVFYAAALGVMFAAFRICFQNLWLPILIHFAIDFQPFIGESGGGGGQSSWTFLLLLFVPLALMAAVTLFSADRDAGICRKEEEKE